MDHWHDIALRKLRRHSHLGEADEARIRALTGRVRVLEPGEDLIHEGDRPHSATLVLTGMIARYHTLPAGRRQYLSFHFPADWPDAQTLFLDRMDHSVCALGQASVVSVRHDAIRSAFVSNPAVGFAIWRETLIDAAIFREAITNGTGRGAFARMAHLFCELFYRAQAAGVVIDNRMALPFNQTQLGEALGLALVTVNRQIQALRRTGAIEFRSGVLAVLDWGKLTQLGDFEPDYLGPAKAPEEATNTR